MFIINKRKINFILFFFICSVSLNDLNAQVFYKTNKKVEKIWLSIPHKQKENYTKIVDCYNCTISKKEWAKTTKKLKKCIELDSNFADSYALLGNIKMINLDFLSQDGALYYYTKCLAVEKKFPSDRLNINGKGIYFNSQMSNPEDGKGEDDIIDIQHNRVKSLIMGYNQNPEKFNPKKWNSKELTVQQMFEYFHQCEEDIQNIEVEDPNRKLDHQELFDFYLTKGEFEFNNGNYDQSVVSFKYLMSILKEYKYQGDKQLARKLCEKMYSLSISIGDNEAALQSLVEFYKIPFSEEEFNSMIFLKKRKEIIRLINVINNLENNYEICQQNNKEVFCDNKNIRLNNYSSTVQFLRLYNQYDILKNVFSFSLGTYHDLNYLIEYGLISPDVKEEPKREELLDPVYSFYKEFGKNYGMVWPKYKVVGIDSDYKESTNPLVLNLFYCDCFRSIIDITNDNIYLSSKSDSTLTAVINIKDCYSDWTMLNNIPVSFFDKHNNVVYKSSSGEKLANRTYCEKLYLIEKQNYENQQALLRAKQLQQEEEVRRLQQEQLYKETQLRILEEENNRKQKEIDLINAQNQQIEKKNELNHSKPQNKSNKKETMQCEWCPRTFNGEGYDYEIDFKACKGYKHFSSPLFNSHGKFCSEKCALESCQSKQ